MSFNELFRHTVILFMKLLFFSTTHLISVYFRGALVMLVKGGKYRYVLRWEIKFHTCSLLNLQTFFFGGGGGVGGGG